MSYKYYLLNRPPGIGCQPDDYINKEIWLPKQFPDDFPRGAFGWVEYSEPLRLEQIYKYDLFPQSILEQVAFIAWEDWDKVIDDALADLKKYWDMDNQEIQKYLDIHDWTAIDIKRLKNAGRTWADLEAVLIRQQVEV